MESSKRIYSSLVLFMVFLHRAWRIIDFVLEEIAL